MSKTFKAYAVVRDNDPVLFAEKVQQYLRAGWLCRGKMQTQRTGTHLFDYLQNMVMPFAPAWPSPSAIQEGKSA